MFLLTKEEQDFQDKLKEVFGLNTGQMMVLHHKGLKTLEDLAILDNIAMAEMLNDVFGGDHAFMTKQRIRAFADWYHDIEDHFHRKPNFMDFSADVCREQMKKMAKRDRVRGLPDNYE